MTPEADARSSRLNGEFKVYSFRLIVPWLAAIRLTTSDIYGPKADVWRHLISLDGGPLFTVLGSLQKSRLAEHNGRTISRILTDPHRDLRVSVKSIEEAIPR